jgi:hypothetical protein
LQDNNILLLEISLVGGNEIEHSYKNLLEITHNAAGTVHTNITRVRNMWTLVWFAHDSNNRNSTGCSYWLGFEKWP